MLSNKNKINKIKINRNLHYLTERYNSEINVSYHTIRKGTTLILYYNKLPSKSIREINKYA